MNRATLPEPVELRDVAAGFDLETLAPQKIGHKRANFGIVFDDRYNLAHVGYGVSLQAR